MNVVLAGAVVFMIFMPWIFGKKFLVKAYIGIMLVLDKHYLCGYSLYQLIFRQLFGRLGDLNEEGFCFTVSAAIMLALRNFATTRLVRGEVQEIGVHSWVEVKYLGRWWVVDPLVFVAGFTDRGCYYRTQKPLVKVVYSKRQFWRNPAMSKFYERLRCSEKSYIFVDLFWYFTPADGIWEIPGEKRDELEFLDDGTYYLFLPCYGYLFSQGIINDLMARQNRKTPKKRTLRRLKNYYRKMAVEM